jgi:hypothetical protein
MGIAKVLLQSELLFYEHVVYRLRVPRWQNETDEAHVAVKIVMQKSIHSVWAFQTRESKAQDKPSRGSTCVGVGFLSPIHATKTQTKCKAIR